MKFILDRKALAGMLRVLGAGGRRTEDTELLRLTACNGLIAFRSGIDEAGCAALVLEAGVCFFRPSQFLPLVRAYAGSANLTVEVTPDGIQIGETKISRGLWEVSLFQNPHTAPATLDFLPRKMDELGGQGQFDFGAA